MTHLDHALALAAQGFHLFPCIPNGKTPAIKAWPAQASREPAKIERWARKYPGCNWGIFTGRFGDDDALLVVDVDNKGAKHGDATLLALELAGHDFPPTCENTTPTGGRHLVYRVPQAVKQGVDVLGQGLDIRSYGGYIVAPGSAVAAGEYRADQQLAPVAAPAWLIERCGAARAKAVNRERLPGIDPERAEKRVAEYLQTAERSVKGAGGDQCAYRVAAKCLSLGATPDQTLELMLSEHWDEGCGWSPERLAEKVEHARRYMLNPQGADAPEAQFEPVHESSENEHDVGDVCKKLHPLDELNRQWALVMTGGGHHLLWETTDFRGNPIVEHVKEGSFHKYHAARELQVGKKTEKLTDVWMASPRRRTYDGLVFAPERPVDARWYNLWRGFDYRPVPAASARAEAAVQSWFDHVERNVCRDDAKLAQWFVGYMAHLVQRPWEKPLTALVLKGRKGTGKNAVIERVGALFSRNMVVADDDRYLVGNFNSHLEACLLLALDEASWAGGKKVEGKLKGIITGSKHMIERKGMEPYQVDNLTRVVIIGNEDWLVPATQDERRYAVFDVGEGDMQKRSFFQEMREGMEANGGEGYGLLLAKLQAFDLSTVDVNDAPKTDGLADQKIESLGPQHSWWLDCLTEGQILGGDFAGEWPESIPTNRLMDAARRYTVERGVRSWQPTKIQFNRAMKQFVPGWHATKSTRAQPGDATYHYPMPTLDDARVLLAEALGKPQLFDEVTT
ncbi:MAG TPA: bifunctional DNA primase/polymerase [Pseudoxanthomonas sp.]|nr:bifunctional DNA primase/polymerase [Pseudoxanthomonas sp.]